MSIPTANVSALSDSELKVVQDELTDEIGKLQVKLDVVVDEIKKREDAKASVLKDGVHASLLTAARGMKALGAKIPAEMLKLMDPEDAKEFEAPKTFADIAETSATPIATPIATVGTVATPAVEKNRRSTTMQSVDEIVKFFMFQYFVLTSDPRWTSFLNPKASFASEKYASSINDIKVFMPFELLTELGFNAKLHDMDALSNDFVEYVGSLTYSGSKSISKALSLVTNIVFTLSLLNMTVTRLTENVQTSRMMKDFANGANPFIELSKRIKHQSEDLGDDEFPPKFVKKTGKGAGKKAGNKPNNNN
jgi:hypothetical protein